MNLTEITLIEMPQDIENIDWHDLNDLNKNHDFYMRLSTDENKTEVFNVWQNVWVYKLRSQYFCLDTKSERISYYMRYEVGNNGKIGDYVWQSLVWSNFKFSYLTGIPQQIFFEQLLPKFGTITTDSQQTWDGKRFWKLRIRDAFEKKFNVYYYDFQYHKCIKMNDIDDFEAIEPTVWGQSDIQKMKRMLITTKELVERK